MIERIEATFKDPSGEIERRLAGFRLGVVRGIAAAVTALYGYARENLLGRIVTPRYTERWRKIGLPALSNSLERGMEVRGTSVRGWVGTPIFYGRLLETGTAAHFLRPRGKRRAKRIGGAVPPQKIARALAIHSSPGAAPFYRAFAHHPGVRERRWMGRALEDHQDGLRQAILVEAQRAMDAAASEGLSA